ncbi:MAG: hypothetical protein IKN17_09130 [Ruminococcus sp.]|nr:hypothetical protein [Ruminococcus sp.]
MKIETDEYSILPDEELREIYKRNRRIRRWLCLPMIPLIILGGFSVSSVANDLLSTTEGTGALSNAFVLLAFIVTFVGVSFVLVENPKMHIRLTLYAMSALLMIAGIDFVTAMLLDMNTVHLIRLLMTLGFMIGVGTVNYVAHSFIKQHEVLKAHPRYPFDNWRKDEQYIFRADGESVLKVIDSSMNKGRVQSVGSEEFLDGETKSYEPPKPDPEKNLQQRKQVWRSHDKAETAHTMDNLKNMYFEDGTQNGELTGSDLERELWKATAPKKPREPQPEDFFQTQPIVWRSKKDDKGAGQPNRPVDDGKGERTVLM